jgi:hypothetical protein
LKHKVVKPPVPRFEETFFEKFFKEPEKPKVVSEEEIESRMTWYYIRKVPIDLMIEGHVVDTGGNYQLITDIGLPTILSIYCTLGKGFDADYIKEMFMKCGFDFLTSQKLYMILQTWRKDMPKDITDEELSRKDFSFRDRPHSGVHEKNLPIYRETFSYVTENFNILEELSNSSCRSASIPCDSQNSDFSTPTQRV